MNMDREHRIDVTSEATCDARILGRLGAELRHAYGDALKAPLPSGLQRLVDQLNEALGS